ncbi:hypothetical protein CJU89_6778 [Yarrowia sp. B02]|nr:hypothetical protein CJU89_6778 [Yarrowia sp. B02]
MFVVVVFFFLSGYLVYTLYEKAPKKWDSFLDWLETTRSEPREEKETVIETQTAQIDIANLSDTQMREFLASLQDIKKHALATKLRATERMKEITQEIQYVE